MINVKLSNELLAFFESQNVIKFSDGTEVYDTDAVIVKDPNGDLKLFSSYKEYAAYLKTKDEH